MSTAIKNKKNTIGFFVFQLVWWGLFYLLECAAAHGFDLYEHYQENLAYFVSPLPTIIGFIMTTLYKLKKYNTKLVQKKYSEIVVYLAFLALGYTMIFSVLQSVLYMLHFIKINHTKSSIYVYREIALLYLFLMFFTWFLIDLLVKNYKHRITPADTSSNNMRKKYYSQEYYILFVFIFWLLYGPIVYYLLRYDWITGKETIDMKTGMFIPLRVIFGIPITIYFRSIVSRLLKPKYNNFKSLLLVLLSSVCFGVVFSIITGGFIIFFELSIGTYDFFFIHLLELVISFTVFLPDIFLFISLASLLVLQTCQIKYYDFLAETE